VSARVHVVPALDGLRAVAVAVVLLFHGGFAWASGGFLGVSTFFTLSGFLITRLLLGEWERDGGIDLRRFWDRRVRRLTPPLLVTVLVVVAGAPWLADVDQLRSLVGDALAALSFTANWRFTAAGESYADLFRAPSLLLHCWSLGVEAQYYLVAPLLVWAALRRGRRPARAVGVVMLGLTLISLAVTAALAGDAAAVRVYYGTDTRLAELAVGGLLAAWLNARGDRVPRWAGPVGIVALAVSLSLCVVTTTSTPWLHRGGLTGYGLLTALVILGLLARGPLARLLGSAPARWLGGVSYGAYLYHWPLFWVLTPERTGLDGWGLFVVRVALTLALAEVSARVLETPVRRGRWPARERVFAAGALATAAVGVVVVVAGARWPTDDPFELAVRALAERKEVENPGGAVEYAVFGDSTAFGGLHALEAWGDRHPGWLVWRHGEIGLGCGVLGSSPRRYWPGPDDCDGWQERWRARVAASDIALAIVQTVRWDIVDQRLPGREGWWAPGMAEFDARLLARMHEAVDALAAEGAVVVWVLSPPIVPVRGQPRPDSAPERAALYNDVARELARQRPNEVALIDLAAHVATLPPADRVALRPDGIHMTRQSASRIADWMGRAVLAAYVHLRPHGRRHPANGGGIDHARPAA